MTVLRAAFCLSFAFAVSACSGGDAAAPAGDAKSVERGEKPVDVRVVDLEGLDGVLAENRGRAVLVNFWATWCVPCVEELPDLIAAARAQGGDDLAVLLVSYDLQIPEADPAKIVPRVEKFVRRQGIEHPVLIFQGDDFDAINERFSLPGHIPVTLALDKTGKIVERWEESAGQARFEALIRAARGS